MLYDWQLANLYRVNMPLETTVDSSGIGTTSGCVISERKTAVTCKYLLVHSAIKTYGNWMDTRRKFS
jgi:hypothetical protein